ncbi:MAG: metallophosphoesterase [Rhodomicrobium sp.]
MLGAADAFAIEPGFSLAVKEWNVTHTSWPSSARPLRIGVLTDIHAVEPWMPPSRIGSIVNRMNGLNPDMIVLLGDYVNALRPHYYTSLVPIAEWMAPLRELHAPLGVYAVLGNHDWWSGEVPAISRAFARAGIHLLENDAVRISWAQHEFWVAGLGDQIAYGLHGVDNLSGTLRQITNGSPALLLAHEPDIFPRVPSRIALTLAGHTHGGQVYIPFLGRPALYASSSRRYPHYAYGHIQENGRHMIVSSGLGLSNFPVRFLVPPEIALITLGSAQA